MQVVIAYPSNKKQLVALKASMRALKIQFRVEINTYDPTFLTKIEQSRQEIKDGKGLNIDPKNLWN
jgi:hypothetical protein